MTLNHYYSHSYFLGQDILYKLLPFTLLLRYTLNTLLQNIIPSAHLISNSISPKAQLLIEKAANFITKRVLPAEAAVLNHS